MFDVQDEHVATLCADEEMAAVLGEAALSDLLAPVWLCVCVCVCVCAGECECEGVVVVCSCMYHSSSPQSAPLFLYSLLFLLV